MGRKLRKTDLLTGKIKCPAIGCHSADVQVIGKKGIFIRRKKYQCRKCGRVFSTF